MCTLTYMPKGSGHIITSSRDESPMKPAISPKTHYIHPYWLTYPTDIKGGGSWIAYNKKTKHTHVLLNGAFQAHDRRPPYGHSRGLIVLKSFNFNSLEAFSKTYILINIEPFTLVRFSQNQNIDALIWDGTHATINQYDRQEPHICSSSTLYSDAMKRERHGWFESLVKKQNPPTADDVWDFHVSGGEGVAPKRNQICMQRDGLKTRSIMQISIFENSITHRYLNLDD